jgi:uncharacterized protein (DUF2141 family)
MNNKEKEILSTLTRLVDLLAAEVQAEAATHNTKVTVAEIRRRLGMVQEDIWSKGALR